VVGASSKARHGLVLEIAAEANEAAPDVQKATLQSLFDARGAGRP